MRWPAFDPGDVTAAWAFLHGMATLLPASPLQTQLGSTDPVTFAVKVINRICTG